MESVILTTPILWIGYGIALLFCLIEIVKKASGYVFPVLSFILVFGTSIYALILNASYYEVAVVILIFLAVHLLAFSKGNGKVGSDINGTGGVNGVNDTVSGEVDTGASCEINVGNGENAVSDGVSGEDIADGSKDNEL